MNQTNTVNFILDHILNNGEEDENNEVSHKRYEYMVFFTESAIEMLELEVHTGFPICSCTWIGSTLIWVFDNRAKVPNHLYGIPNSWPLKIYVREQMGHPVLDF